MTDDQTREDSAFSTPELLLAPEPSDLEDRTLLDLASDQGMELRADCGGQGLCGKCLIRVDPPEALTPPTPAEKKLLGREELAGGLRLACQVHPRGPVRVQPGLGAVESFTDGGKAHLDGQWPVQPLVRRMIVRAWSDDGPGGPDLLGRVLTGMADDGADFVPTDPVVLRSLSAMAPGPDGLTLVGHRHKGLTALHPGQWPRSLGLAVDLGTTTLAAYLVDMNQGRILATAAGPNPQRRAGADVISRIAHVGREPGGLEQLRNSVVGQVDALLDVTLAQVQASPADVDEVVVVGNTTMQQIFCGLDPGALGRAPYLPVSRAGRNWRAGDLGLNLAPLTNVYVFPVLSGFVGGDALAGILAVEPHRSDQPVMLVDLGTNGEVILGSTAGLWATSCATGPALEGAHLSCGMRAVRGAVERVEVDPATGVVSYAVIGRDQGAKPMGLCGSGVVDAVAGLRRAGFIVESGRFREGRPGVHVDDSGVGRRFVLVPGTESATGEDLSLTLLDVRQIQLAKGALATGMALLRARAGVGTIGRVVLTGAFGARFDWHRALDIGMLPPPGTFEHMAVVENTAGLGAVLALLHAERRAEAERLVEQVKVIELADEPDFAKVYQESLAFPGIPDSR